MMIFPSRIPLVVFVPPFRVTTRDFPDCEIESGEFETEEKKSLQAEATGWLDTIFQVPSTENGAVRWRPLFRIPTSPAMGRATRKM